ncbi:ATP-grasp fold amidoligase family protein [Tropicimonas sp. IMCC34011]|uniref:ATP-grasp fold amidoligase family protein n=1 Tax=Tropicimonas sp. IMCC34011 TaxID=2248759 RepID=UPI0013008E18|nr:ATP-grasp fold amidoligase family protein [Tropicimonas sp. IMCC34011]
MTPYLPDRLLFAAVNLWVRLRHRRLVRYCRGRPERWAGMPWPALPRSVSEKFTWRKLFDHDPRFVLLSDKLAVRRWARDEGIDVPFPRLLWEGTDSDVIPASLLAQDVVLKANHGSSMNIFPARTDMDDAAIRARAACWLRTRYGEVAQETAYLSIKPRLFVEESVGFGALEEIKFYTFGPEIGRIFRSRGRDTPDEAATILLPDGTGGFEQGARSNVVDRTLDAPLPECWDRLVELARRIGGQFDQVRVDFLVDGERFWLGELTLYTQKGYIPAPEAEAGGWLAEMWDIRRSRAFESAPRGWRGVYLRRLKRHLGREAAARGGAAAEGQLTSL